MAERFAVPIPQKSIAAFCRRNHIRQLALFGSVLRDDFGPNSDIDVLVEFEPETHYSLFALARMQSELEVLLGRRVDLIEKRALESSRNYVRREGILGRAETIYAAR